MNTKKPMKKTEPTQGDWDIEAATRGRLPIRIMAEHQTWKGKPFTHVADVGGDLANGVPTYDEALANARLMCASKEALRVMKVLRTWMDAGSDEIHLSTLMPEGTDETETIGGAVLAFFDKLEA